MSIRCKRLSSFFITSFLGYNIICEFQTVRLTGERFLNCTLSHPVVSGIA
jgi:hypothetical protein